MVIWGSLMEGEPMNEICFKCTTDLLDEFFSKYDFLGDVQKQIWKRICWFVKKFPNAFPGQETLAKKIGCSRKHINRTLAKFAEFGWVSLSSRGARKTKTLHISPVFVQIDLVNRKWFKRTEVTSEVTHSNISNRIFTGKAKGEIFKRKNTTLDPSPLGRELKMSDDGALKLSLLPDAIQHEALRIAKQLGSQGWQPEKPEQYFLGIGFKIARERNIQ